MLGPVTCQKYAEFFERTHWRRFKRLDSRPIMPFPWSQGLSLPVSRNAGVGSRLETSLNRFGWVCSI
jgi:hypothetical protein